jgi:hypothetical protein
MGIIAEMWTVAPRRDTNLKGRLAGDFSNISKVWIRYLTTTQAN